MTEAYGNVTRLGVYMRQVGAILQATVPVDEADALKAMSARSGCVDLGYAAATLIRLADRGIALRCGDSMLFIRGSHWDAAAKLYGWNQ